MGINFKFIASLPFLPCAPTDAVLVWSSQRMPYHILHIHEHGVLKQHEILYRKKYSRLANLRINFGNNLIVKNETWFAYRVYEGVFALLSYRGTFWRSPCEDRLLFGALPLPQRDA